MSNAPDDRPLTPEQRALVTSVVYLARSIARRCPRPFIDFLGMDGVVQEACVGACRAAVKYDAAHGSWSGYAFYGMRSHLSNVMRKLALRATVWREWPHNGDGVPCVEPAAGSQPGGTVLGAWCAAGSTRAHLPLRWRVILYLIAVEGWRVAEIADALGVSRQRLSDMRDRAVESLWAGVRTKRRGKSGAKNLSSLT